MARLFIALIGITLISTDSLTGQDKVPTVRGINNSLGFREHRPGYWSYINPEIINPLDEGAELEVVAFFGCAQNQKYAKRIFVPARSILQVSLPILIPDFDQIPVNESTGRPDELLTVQVHLYDLSGDQPVLLVNDGKRSYDTSIKTRVARFGQTGEKYRSSAMFSPNLAPASQKMTDAEDLVSAARIFFMQEGAVGMSLTKFLPDSMRAFDSIDQLVIHNDHLLHDSGGLQSVRRWLARGGHLWIMLDSVSEETVRRILGDSIPFEVIDRTSLNHVQIKDADLNSQVGEPEKIFFEKPVDFVRVMLEDGDLTHTQDGWPAAFWLQSGRGKILFTTLGARAWMKKKRDQFQGFRTDDSQDGRLGQTDYTLNDPMETLAFEVFAQEKPEEPFDAEVMKANLIGQVGYSVLSRSTVVTILSLYVLALLGTGLWFAKRQSLDKLFFVGPGLAILTAIVFYFIGLTNKQAAPPSVASYQFVRAISGLNEFQVDGMTIIYAHDNLPFEYSGSNDGNILRHSNMTASSESKIVWTEDGAWVTPKQNIEPGLISFDVTSNVKAESPLIAKATFGENGLAGTIQGPDNLPLEDLLLAVPGGHYFSIKLNEESRFQVGAQDVLAENRFIESSLLSDKQRWHQSIYEGHFPADDFKKWARQMTVYAWSDPLETDVAFPSEFKRVGGAMLKIPLDIANSPAGTRVTVPAEFIEIENAINSFRALSPCFDRNTKKWIGSTAKESSTRLRFQIPPQTLPLQIDEIKLSIGNVAAPDRRVEIKSVAGNPGTVVASFDNQNGGAFSKSLTDPAILELDEQGGFLLDIDIKVDPEFYERQAEVEKSGERNSDGTQKKLVLERDKLDEIRIMVSGTVQERTINNQASNNQAD